MKINWVNKLENFILIMLTLAAVKFVMIMPLENQLERQNQTIERLAEREKYSYQILNRFEKKIKAKDGQLIIDLNNTMDNEQITPERDSIFQEPEKEKPGFFKRLFNKN